MIKKLRSGKFWLKCIFFSSLLWFAVMSMGYAISVWGLTDARIRSSLEAAMPAGRTVSFSQITGRDWLPYPSVTLSDVAISYPNRTGPQLTSKELSIDLGWSSLFGQVEIQKMRLLQPQLQVARLQDNTWNIDDFYAKPHASGMVNDIEIIDGTLNVQETNHKYDLTGINAAINQWQAPQSNVHLAFDWQSALAGKQQINIEAQIQKNATGFHSDKIQVKIENSLPKVGKVSWLGTAKLDHIWLEHSSTFKDIALTGSDEQELFKANLSIPEARWRKIWRIPQTNGLVQWQNKQHHMLTTTLKMGATEISSQAFKTTDSNWDILYKQANETLSVKAAGQAQVDNKGEFMLNNWQISSRQTDVNLQTDALFRSDGVLKAFGNINQHWALYWDGSWDGEDAKIEVNGSDSNTVQLDVTAQKLDLERYQNWLEKDAAAVQASTDSNQPPVEAPKATVSNTNSNNDVNPWFEKWGKLPNQWQLTGQVDLGELTTKQMQLSQFHADVNLTRQALNINNIKATAYGGTVQAVLQIPRADEEENILQVNIQDVDVQPWLMHWQEYNRFSGHANMVLHLTAQGNRWSDIRSHLNGEIGVELKDGSFHGVALESLLNNTSNTNVQLKLDDSAQTDFDLLTSHSTIQNGVFDTDIFDLTMPLGLRLSGQGKYHLPNNKLDYQLKFGPSLMEKAALPIRVSGPILQPNFALDYQSLTKGLTNSVDKSNAVREVLKRQWQLWQMPELPATKP